MDRRLFLSTLLTGSLAAAGAALAQPAPPPYMPVPPLRDERMPPPREGFVWEPGHWRWDGRAYFWERGHWIAYGPRHRLYVQGHWERRGPGWFWVDPHWE